MATCPKEDKRAKRHLGRPDLDVVICRTIVEHRNEPINRVPHHREVFAVPTGGLQGFPAAKQKRGGLGDRGGWQDRETREPHHGRGETRLRTEYPATRGSKSEPPRRSVCTFACVLLGRTSRCGGAPENTRGPVRNLDAGFGNTYTTWYINLIAHSKVLVSEIEQS